MHMNQYANYVLVLILILINLTKNNFLKTLDKTLILKTTQGIDDP